MYIYYIYTCINDLILTRKNENTWKYFFLVEFQAFIKPYIIDMMASWDYNLISSLYLAHIWYM